MYSKLDKSIRDAYESKVSYVAWMITFINNYSMSLFFGKFKIWRNADQYIKIIHMTV